MNSPLLPKHLQPAPSETESFAEQQHGRLLINCYAREVAMQEHTLAVLPASRSAHPAMPADYRGQVLEIALPRLGSQLCVGVLHVSATANFDYTTGVYLRTGQEAWRDAGWRELARLIIEDLSCRAATPFNEELLQQIGDSIATMQDVMDRRPAPALPPAAAGATPLQPYIGSEQGLLTGHPFHPAPKSRSDWSPAEQRDYSPEHKASMRLHYFQLPQEWLLSDSIDAGALQTLGAHGLQPGDGGAILPLHPWQAGWMRRQPRIASALCSGEILDLGPHGLPFHPTASVRTLLAEDAASFVKLSLNMRITNCIRNNARHELQSALTGTRLYRTVQADMQSRFPGFRVMEEQAYVTADLPGADPELSNGFGVLLREGVAGLLQQGVQPIVCAALFGNGEHGRKQVFAQIERYALHRGYTLEQAARRWFARYAETAVHPILYLLFEHGVAFEPHMQNTVVGLDGEGAPSHFILRDLELTRLAPQAHALARAMQLEPGTLSALCCTDERAWIRIGYCLFVNNLCEVIASIANGNHTLYLGLWGVLRNTLQDYLAKFPNPSASRRIRGLLAGEPLPAKGNLLTRFLRQADRQASYLPLYHPLGVVNGAAASY
ncbi:IucA/IucC family protein [Duganella violaceipulchra]|uniref:IucA/IucC family siderophore biosynthesis protein n=1 Tax=Duganella violaceipulchra TaxID=2849652 RepID=A0AA41HGU1_9BURK|nr:IucA/IucC family protein [Duganella violaceicalia]MBV6323513.1 IucA/IucC family siderophore biosynthesis protein [Duganella violaceicalia]MCP2008867.1 siderophore synthetase component [Duganella violaceicalia]